MCSTLKYKNCVGRNYDYQKSFDEIAIYVPQSYDKLGNSYSMIGIGSGYFKDYPMFYDGMNEKGLFAAGLAFENNAIYHSYNESKINFAPYEVIPKILGNFHSVNEFMDEVVDYDLFNIVDEKYDENTENADLHWFVCDNDDCIVIESTKNGVDIYNNSFEVLTNNPPFDLMSSFIGFRLNLMEKVDESDFCKKFFSQQFATRGTQTYSLGGGYTSIERFERLAFLKKKMMKNTLLDPVGDCFKLLDSVEQLYGLTPVDDSYEYTIYKAVYDLDEKKLFTKTYSDRCYYPNPIGFEDFGSDLWRCSL